MQDILGYISSHFGIILQGLVFLCVNFAIHYIKGTTNAIVKLQEEMQRQNEKFKDYMTNERCEYHRKILEAHMSRTDAKLAEFSKQCKKKCSSTCKNKTENI